MAQLKAVSTRHKADLGYALAITSATHLGTGGAESNMLRELEYGVLILIAGNEIAIESRRSTAS